MTAPPEATLHASAVALGGRGVLIRGASGSGKSSLALAILHAEGDRARLVADDRVAVARDGDAVTLAPPAALAGLIEVRGQGILDLPHLASAPLALVVDLLPAAECPRYPEAGDRRVVILGLAVPRIFVACEAPSGPARVAFALAGRTRDDSP